MKYYDIYYKLDSPSTFSVRANSPKEAKEKAQKVLYSMPKEEIIDRFLWALEVDPTFSIECVDFIEDEEDEKCEGAEAE